MNKSFKRILAFGLTCAMLAGCAMAEGTMKEELGNALAAGSSSMYDGAAWVSQADKLPASFDLRDQGVVPEVRNQGNWSTCWGFAGIGASEISILSELGMTPEEYQEKYGHEMNLSEKHLAWFTYSVIPEGENQAGEGIVLLKDDETHVAHYKQGGDYGYASTLFSAGEGPVWEIIVPYKAADGSDDTKGDWTLSEDLRYLSSYELENSALLPAPAGTDADGNYVYNPMGTEAIKQELLAGHAVAIGYHADQSKSLEASLEDARELLTSRGYPEERTNRLIELRLKYGKDKEAAHADPELAVLLDEYTAMVSYNLTYDQYLEMKEAAENAENDPEAAAAAQAAAEAQAQAAAEAEAASRAAAAEHGVDYDQMVADALESDAADKRVYINTDTYAQYTDNTKASLNHGVCIVGWDDNYDVSNFLPDCQPPANGAWIVRNSWGSTYGNDGYFYLSYYDQTIYHPESFDFVVYSDDEQVSAVDIHAYDLMPAEDAGSAKMDTPTYQANVFETREEEVLSAVSVMTASMNTKVTIAVYLLNDNAASPVDGVMLDTVTTTFEFGGYHRISLNQNYVIPANAKISIVQLQRCETTEGTKYAVPYTAGNSLAGLEDRNSYAPGASCYSNAVIDENVSFVLLDDEWVDWAKLISDLQAVNKDARFHTFDNLNMKAYFYRLDEVKGLHHFGETVNYYGVEAQICEDCGYTVVVP